MYEWPTTIPKTPLIDGYDRKLRDSRLISMPDAGYSKMRNRFTSVPIDVQETFLFTSSEYQIFNNFYENDLSFGSLVFLREDPFTQTVVEHRFKSVPSVKSEGLHIKVSFTLEILPS